jgi:hypothetical protein
MTRPILCMPKIERLPSFASIHYLEFSIEVHNDFPC